MFKVPKHIHWSVLKVSSGKWGGQTDGHVTFQRVSHNTLPLQVTGYKNSFIRLVILMLFREHIKENPTFHLKNLCKELVVY